MLPGMSVRVVLAEDNYLVREGVSRLLAACAEVEIVATCGDLNGLIAAVEAEKPDVVVTDIRMPPDHRDEGIRAASILRETQPEVGVVVLSQYAEPRYALALLESGSSRRGYLLKERVSDIDQLVAAIIEVSSGGSVVDPRVVETLVAGRREDDRSPIAGLTPRERQVLAAMAEGKNNEAIAATLVITERSVEKYINAIFSKLGIKWEPESHHRVRAVLMYLGESDA
jgi:DNA-binding NarL/FixJ family response regulator